MALNVPKIRNCLELSSAGESMMPSGPNPAQLLQNTLKIGGSVALTNLGDLRQMHLQHHPEDVDVGPCIVTISLIFRSSPR